MALYVNGNTLTWADAVAITPSDSTPLPQPCKGIFVGVAGNIKLVTTGGNTVVFANVPVGVFPVSASQVFDTGTAASSLVALY